MPRLKLDPLSPSGVSFVTEQATPTRQGVGYVVNKVTGLITAGSNVTISGQGTQESPYNISSSGTGGGSGGGDASTNTSTSVDSEVVLFSGTAGKTLKRATSTGIAKLASGVLGTAAAGTDYLAPTGNGSGLTGITESQITNLTTDLAAKSPALNPTAVKSGAYTLVANDFVPVDTTAGSVTLTLPTTPADGTRVGVKMVTQGGTNTVTITAGGSDVFNKTGGNTSVTVSLANQSVQFQYNSGIWYGVAADIGVTALDARYQKLLSLTTTGTSGAATLIGTTLNIPQYAGGGTGITRSVSNISTNTTAGAAASTDYTYFVTLSPTLTLPTAVSNTNRYTVNNDGSGTVTVATTSSQTINGSTTVTLSPNTTLEFISNNTQWKVI